MFNDEDNITAKGVILWRELAGEKNLRLTLFLEDAGLVKLSSKNFVGESEPFMWGYFYLQKMKRSARYFIHDMDIKDDMFSLRRHREILLTAMKWVRTLKKYLPEEQPDNDLLENLFWSMKLLDVTSIPVEAVSWRFIWLWLEEWGLAPEITHFLTSNGFNNEEILLLSQLATFPPQELPQLFTDTVNPDIRANVFRVAVPLAENFLNEK